MLVVTHDVHVLVDYSLNLGLGHIAAVQPVNLFKDLAERYSDTLGDAISNVLSLYFSINSSFQHAKKHISGFISKISCLFSRFYLLSGSPVDRQKLVTKLPDTQPTVLV